MRLRKALYGLKQAFHDKYHTLSDFPIPHGFCRTLTDLPFFILGDSDNILMILVHVDE